MAIDNYHTLPLWKHSAQHLAVTTFGSLGVDKLFGSLSLHPKSSGQASIEPLMVYNTSTTSTTIVATTKW